MLTILALHVALMAVPNPATTPGARNPAIDFRNQAQTICNPHGWTTKLVRPPVSVTNAIKARQMRALGYTVPNPLPRVMTKRGGTRPDIRLCVPRSANPACYELDHVIALTLGGHPSAEANLWPQPIADAL